jgi:CBS-domain-containing membrane protein
MRLFKLTVGKAVSDPHNKQKTNSVVRVRERTIVTERLSTKLVSTFADRGCYVVSVTNPYGRILGFLDLSRYFFIQAAPQFYSRG